MDLNLMALRFVNYPSDAAVYDQFDRLVPPPYAGASVSMMVQVSMFEDVNGVMGDPVAVYNTPEPGTISLVLGPILWVLWRSPRK